MKRIALLILAAVVIVGVMLTLNSDVSAKKRKGKRHNNAGQAAQMAQSRNVATVPNFTPAAGSFLIPNSDTVTNKFVLQGDTTGGATWATIPVTEYELFAKSGYIAQRPFDLVTGTGTDWSIYFAYRLSAYTKSVSGTRTSYTNQSVTFAETDTGYSPIGIVGEINGEAIKNLITNTVVAGGANVVIDDNGATFQAGNNVTSQIRWVTGGNTVGDVYTNNNAGTAIQTYVEASNDATSDVTQVFMRAVGDGGAVTSAVANTDTGTPTNSNLLVTVNDVEVLDVRETTSTLNTPLTLNGLLNTNSDRIRIQNTHTPSSASDTGTTGDIAWDSSFLYICVSANTWKRVAISTW